MKLVAHMQTSNPVQAGALAVVVGAGRSGEAAARLLHRLGATVRLVEKNAANISRTLRDDALVNGYEVLTGPHSADQFKGACLVVPSPGVPRGAFMPLVEAAGAPMMPHVPQVPPVPAVPLVLGEMELASRFVHEPILAVTGTSGKTTTVSLAAAMLREAGKSVFLGGNIGTPLSEYVLGGTAADVLVLEVSSFQLMGCVSFHPRVAVLVNIAPNHLDQHTDMAEYSNAKFRLFQCQSAADTAVLPPELLEEARGRNITAALETFTQGIDGQPVTTRLLGAHNQANIAAAYAACRPFGVSRQAAERAAAQFAPMEHRLECAGEWNGVMYINDSKSTTVDALKVALASMERPVLLLAGGVFKGGDLHALLPLMRQHVKRVALFGDNEAVFRAAWQGQVPLEWFPTLEDAMKQLRAHAAPGDVMLLSPATASYDLYANYEKRGADFKRIAELLQ